eukprot:TRINITY_DN65_c0_g2_i2.p2 TRINITY_DN65_c0_g2~~TRINITY_DN65_c0_g2_i2.p2  ORF type:complete len:428 (+),score=26.93 TRINITY_DN65_c0_g2_i2:50-1285(+)
MNNAAKTVKAFLDISISNVPKGRLLFEIYQNRTPKTTHNFLSLCKGFTNPQGRFLSYKGCKFHKIVPFLMAQSGDVLTNNGSSNTSVYGSLFENELGGLSHDGPGTLSTANDGPNANGSQFFITFAPVDWLDEKHTAFGKLVEGMHVLNMIEYCGSTNGKPKEIVTINHCGVLNYAQVVIRRAFQPQQQLQQQRSQNNTMKGASSLFEAEEKKDEKPEERVKTFLNIISEDELKRKHYDTHEELRKKDRYKRFGVKRGMEDTEEHSPDFKCTVKDLPQFVGLLHSADLSQVYLGALGIRKLLAKKDLSPIQEIIDSGAVPKLIKLLGPNGTNPSIQYEAAWCLTNIATGTSDQIQALTEKGVVPKLISLIASPHDHIKEQVCLFMLERKIGSMGIGKYSGRKYGLQGFSIK